MLGCATGVGLAAERGRTAGSRWEWPRLGRPEIDRLVAILRVRISPGLTPETVSNIRTSPCGILSFSYCQNVVLVGAGRFSRSARIATSSELLYLLNLLYNMPIECCVEYKLIQLYQKSSVWCFAFSQTSTFELISSVTNGLTRSLGNNNQNW